MMNDPIVQTKKEASQENAEISQLSTGLHGRKLMDQAFKESQESWKRMGSHIDEALSHIAKAKVEWRSLRPKR